MATFVVWNDGHGNSNLDPPTNKPFQLYDAQITYDIDGEGDETININYNPDRLIERT